MKAASRHWSARVVILGSGPNRIGQGIEFDYCCVHAAQSFRALGYEAVMVNCNPETVSTDYDTSDRLYFEPLGVEEVLAICEREQPEGVVIQFGGQTPLKLARGHRGGGLPRSSGTPYEAVDLAEDRERFAALLRRARDPLSRRGGWPRAPTRPSRSRSGSATRCSCAPRYVLGGRAMRICYDAEAVREAAAAAAGGCSSTASSRTRSRSTSTRSATGATPTSPPSCSTSRRRASTPATRAACSRRRR